MLLDFDDLYNYLKGIFEPPGLPENLRTALSDDNISTFLFLGFQLDRWYTQLLIRWLSDVAGAERFASYFDWQLHNRDIGEFVEKHLNVMPTGTRRAFELLDDIYRAIPAERRRTLTDPASPNAVAIRRAVQNGELEKALILFDQVAEAIGEKQAATMLFSQYRELKAALTRYDLTKEQFWEKCQNLKFRLLDFIEKHAQTL